MLINNFCVFFMLNVSTRYIKLWKHEINRIKTCCQNRESTTAASSSNTSSDANTTIINLQIRHSITEFVVNADEPSSGRV